MKKLLGWQDFFIRLGVIALMVYFFICLFNQRLPFFTKGDLSGLLDTQKDEIVNQLALKNKVATTGVVNGLDLSHFQGDVVESADYKEIDFVIFKATQGTDFTDPKFGYNYTHTPKDVVKGAYHFYNTGEDPVAQADHFLEVVKLQDSTIKAFTNMLPPILDVERGSIDVSNLNRTDFKNNIKKWLQRVEQVTGKEPIIYGSSDFLEDYLDDFYFKKYQLWVAEWRNVRKPMVPWIWDGKWLFWQKTDSYQYGPDLVDYDVFNGSYQQLQQLTQMAN